MGGKIPLLFLGLCCGVAAGLVLAPARRYRLYGRTWHAQRERFADAVDAGVQAYRETVQKPPGTFRAAAS